MPGTVPPGHGPGSDHRGPPPSVGEHRRSGWALMRAVHCPEPGPPLKSGVCPPNAAVVGPGTGDGGRGGGGGCGPLHPSLSAPGPAWEGRQGAGAVLGAQGTRAPLSPLGPPSPPRTWGAPCTQMSSSRPPGAHVQGLCAPPNGGDQPSPCHGPCAAPPPPQREGRQEGLQAHCQRPESAPPPTVQGRPPSTHASPTLERWRTCGTSPPPPPPPDNCGTWRFLFVGGGGGLNIKCLLWFGAGDHGFD